MLSITALLTLLPAVLAGTIRIDVGMNGLVYSPNSVQASAGDVLEFHYYPRDHSVTQSSFAAPCVPLSGGVNSGFVPVASTDAAATTHTFNVVVNDTKPIWFYCAQGDHCQSGMSMVVNQASSGANTLTAYQAAAMNADTVVGTVSPVGGTFSAASSNSSSSSMMSSSMMSSSMMESSSMMMSSTMAGAGSASTTPMMSTATSMGSMTSSAMTATSSAAVASGAAAPVELGRWAVAAGVAAAGGLLF